MSRLHTPRAWLVAASAAVSLVVLAGCQSNGDGAEVSSPGSTSTQDSDQTGGDLPAGPTETPEDTGSPTGSGSAQDAPEGLEEFYTQSLDWSTCEGTFECAGLAVPLDYQDPEGAVIELALLRSPAGGQAQGSLVVNPGGPGSSGVDYAMLSAMVISSEVRDVYDVVGFDPRGVARSAPIECVTDEQMDAMLGFDPSPDTAEELEQREELQEQFAQGCVQNAPELMGQISTVEAARDMDILRSSLGDEQLTYVGASYGTFLGTTYATLFPERVGRLVFDGAMDPTLSAREINLGQAEGFERASRAYAESCVSTGECPLGDDVETAVAGIPAFLDELDANPLPVRGDTVEELTGGWGMYGIIVAMYDEVGWPLLSQALAQAQQGDGTMLMFLANLYASRSSDGSYDGNGMQAIRAINCLDRPAEDSVEPPDRAELVEQFEQVSPTWGRYLASAGCRAWPAEAQETIEDYSAAGADPIVVIGTTRDPATPYEWAVSLAEILDSGVLVSYDGDGHTAYGRSNDCVQDAVDGYLIEGTVPEDGLRC